MKLSLPFIALTLLAAAPAEAQLTGPQTAPPQATERVLRTTVVESDFTGTAPGANAPWTATAELFGRVDFQGWVHGPGSLPVDAIDDGFGFKFAGSTAASTLGEAFGNGHYLSCTLAPKGGRPLDLSGAQVRFRIDRDTWFAARRFAVYTNVGGFWPGDELFATEQLENNVLDEREFSFFLPESGYDALTAPLEIRIYAWEFGYLEHLAALTGFIVERGVPTSTIDLTAGPGGTVALNPDYPTYATGATLAATAIPDPGYRFSGWAGDLQGFGNPREFLLDRNKQITATFEPVPWQPMAVGTNLAEVHDYNTDWPFVDLHMRARSWQTREVGTQAPYDTGWREEIPVDANGWPIEVPFTASDGSLQYVHTIVARTQEAGNYRLTYEGTGELWFERNSDPVPYPIPTGGPQVYEFSLTAAEPVSYEIRSTAPSDPLRNFRLVHESHWNLPPWEAFHPLFLERLGDFELLRFMDWARTNASPLVDWSDRGQVGEYTQAQDVGTAYELMIQLANRLGTDAWFCVPHRATDAFTAELAELIHTQLHPGAKVYVEYSNETWNTAGQFPQSVYVQDQGELLGLDANRWQAGHDFVAQRSLRVWEIFAEQFGAEAESRLVKVLGSHAANPDTTALRIRSFNDPELNPQFIQPDVVAIAPYFGINFFPIDLPPNASQYPTVDEIVGPVALQSIQDTAALIAEQRALANSQGWGLVCYEGGQHFVGVLGAENDDTLTDLLIQANRDPRMYYRYIEYLDMLQAAGIELFGNFTYCSDWGKWGTWGVLEYQNQALVEAHKYRAVIDWAAGN